MLYDFQRALLTLYTNGSALSAFRTDPALKDFSLTERERRAICGIPIDELAAFNEGLRSKRMRVARAVLEKRAVIVLVAFLKDSPALVWGSGQSPRVVPISFGSARLMRELYRAREKLSLGALLRAWRHVPKDVTMRDLFELARLMYVRGLAGKTLFI